MASNSFFRMCPLWPLHILLLYVLCLAPLLLMAQHVPSGKALQPPKALSVSFAWNVTVDRVTEGENKTVEFNIANLNDFSDSGSLELALSNTKPDVADVQLDERSILLDRPSDFSPNTSFKFNLTGKFLGYTRVAVQLLKRMSANETHGDKAGKLLAVSDSVNFGVIRQEKSIDKAFVYTVAVLVSVAFINMGCLLDLDIVKATLKKPIGPIIGLCCQYFFMPLCAFGLAKWLLWDNIALQLGLFVTGCSPGGGGSNIWTFLLGGNLNLSITMTFISTLLAFAMMPLWTMTLGRLVLTEGMETIVVPYNKIATMAAGLVIPLVLGLLIRRYCVKVADFLGKTLKYLALFFVVFIVGFGIYANLYMFHLMNDWRVLVSSFSLVMLGYVFGGVTSLLLRQSWPDALTVAIETGIQNTGIAIFILRFTLPQPEADVNTVIPVAVAIFTPAPLIILWLLQKCVFSRYGICIRESSVESGDVDYKVKTITNGNGHLPNGCASAAKLLPNNNTETNLIVNVPDVDN